MHLILHFPDTASVTLTASLACDVGSQYLHKVAVAAVRLFFGIVKVKNKPFLLAFMERLGQKFAFKVKPIICHAHTKLTCLKPSAMMQFAPTG